MTSRQSRKPFAHLFRNAARRTSRLREERWHRPLCERLEDRLAPTVTAFQQGVGGYTATLDTNLWAAAPTLFLGDEVEMIVSSNFSASGPAQGLLRFDNIFGTGTNQIPAGAVINSAALLVDVTDVSGGNINLHRMLITWTEASTWSSLNNGVSLNNTEATQAREAALNPADGLGPRTFDVTQTLRNWSYGAANHGWVIVCSNDDLWIMGTSESLTAAFRPRLVVDWSPPTPGVLDVNTLAITHNEGAGNITITINRTQGAVGAVSVDYVTFDGSATAGPDYTQTEGTLPFANGQFSRTLTIPIINDTVAEEDEYFYIVFYNTTGGAQLGPQWYTVFTVVDNDGPGVFQFNAATYTVGEATANAVITVERLRASDGVARVNYLSYLGTAAPGLDYTPVSGTLTFNNAVLTQTFNVPIINDMQPEGDETVILYLTEALDGAALGARVRAVLTIRDNDATARTFREGASSYAGTQDTELRQATPDLPQGSATVISVDESDGCPNCRTIGMMRFDNIFGTGTGQVPLGSTIISATLTLNVSNVSNGQISFHRMLVPWDESSTWNSMVNGIDRNDIEARATADSVFTNTAVTGAQNINITASLQAWSSGAPYFGWALFNSTGDGWDFASSENGTAGNRPLLSVLAVPPAPGVFEFSAAEYTINESGGNLLVTVNRSAGTAGAVSVDYATFDYTAVGGKDYEPAYGTLNFADGQATQTFMVPITNESVVEDDEFFYLYLYNPTGDAVVGENGLAQVTIVDNDGPGILQFSAATYTVGEAGGTATITVNRSRASDGPVSVDYFSFGGTATPDVDYVPAFGTVDFAHGQTSATFTVTITDDQLMELNETVELFLYNEQGGATLGPRYTAVLTITDDEPRLLIQEGLGGYAGTQDTELRAQTPGTAQGANASILVDLNEAGFQRQGLLRFDNLFGPGPNQIPAGATILQATVGFQVTNATAGTISLHRMLVTWNESSTWNSLTRGLTPITEHLLAADGQRAPASGTGVQTFDVTASLLAWQAGATNFGWGILNTTGDGWEVRSSEYTTTETERPTLTVIFQPGRAPEAPGQGSVAADPAVPGLLLAHPVGLPAFAPPATEARPLLTNPVDHLFLPARALARAVGELALSAGAEHARSSAALLEGWAGAEEFWATFRDDLI